MKYTFICNKKNSLIKILYIVTIIIMLFPSCVSKSKINYFQQYSELDTLAKKNINSIYIQTLKNDDFLAIEVTALDEESIKPFLLKHEITSSQAPNYSSGIAATKGYLINSNGEIELPFIGKLKLSGLTRMEATELIQNKLSEYIQNPIITIRIQNFKVTVLGDVRNPGSFNIPNERITLPEILGIAGDLNITGIRKNVLVIRDINGIKTEYRIDLTSQNVFQSPAYYLQQNDVVYVEPNRAKRNSSLISSTAGVFISIASLIITTVNLVTK